MINLNKKRSFGCLLFEMTQNKKLFGGKNVYEIIQNILKFNLERNILKSDSLEYEIEPIFIILLEK